MKTIGIAIPFILWSLLGTAQDSLKLKPADTDMNFCNRHFVYHADSWTNALALKSGFSVSKYPTIELGLQWMTLLGTKCDPYGTMGFSLGNDFVFDQNRVIHAPKLSAEFQFMIFGARINTSFYTEDFKTGSLKLKPEVGLSMMGYLNLFYGYNFNLTQGDFYPQGHTITLYTNLPLIKFYNKRLIRAKDINQDFKR